ncbi:MAG: DoxX family protein [Pseudomonadota bacterium]
MIYWVSTSLLCAYLLASALSYLVSQNTIDGIRDLGFPDFFRVQLAILKLLAIPALLLPMVPLAAKEWAYAGVALFILTAIVAHFAHGDPWVLNLLNAALLAILIASYVTLPR